MTPMDRIDSAISDAAARLTRAKPSDALRTNVMERIAVERPVRFPWRYVFAGGALASVGLVAFLSWPDNSAISQLPVSTPTLITPTVISSAAAASADPTAATNRPSPLSSVARTVAAHDSGQMVFATLNDADQEWLSRSVSALEHPELITVNPLLHNAPINAIEPMRVAPLVVTAIGDDNQ